MDLQPTTLGKLDIRLKVHELVSAPEPDEAARQEGANELTIASRPRSLHRKQDHGSPVRKPRKEVVGHRTGLIAPCLDPAVRAGGSADLGEQQPEEIRGFRRGPDGGSRSPDRIFLLDGDRRADVHQAVHVGPVHLFDEHAGVGGQGFDVPPLPLGEEGIEREGGLA